MNTVKRSIRETVVITMESVAGDGRINRREISDFIIQADRAYENDFGNPPESDDAYFIYGDEDGLHAEYPKDD